MKARLNMSFAIAGTALILLTGCVSSRKYKTSQAELATARMDSAQLAQKDSLLNANVNDLQGRNSALRHSLDSSNNSYAAQQKSLDQYRGYFKEQQDTLAQVSADVSTALTQSGITNGDVQQGNHSIYVRLDENELFKKNSTMITPAGKKILDGLSQVVVSRSNINVAVATGDSAVGWVATNNMSSNGMSSDATMTAPKHHHHVMHSSASSANNSAANNGASGSSAQTAAAPATTSGTAARTNPAPAPHKVHHHYSSEGSMAIHTGPGHSHAWALKQARLVTVSDHFLKNGLPKINLSLQQPPMNGTPQSTAIKIIITPSMKDFNPQNPSSSALN
jgi:outer membrane protein OmpA-like peptidoglycan-associated protein